MLSNDSTNNEAIIKKIIDSWTLFQDEAFSERSEREFKHHILSTLAQTELEQDKISYIIKTKEILDQQFQTESLNQSQEDNKKAQIKKTFFNNLLLLVCLEIEQDFIYQIQIRKLIHEQEAEFQQALQKIRQELEDWDLNISLQVRGIIERMEREYFLKILIRNIQNAKKITVFDELISNIKAKTVEFLEQSGFNTTQIKEFHDISEKSLHQLSKSTEDFTNSLSELNALDDQSFASEKDIDAAVENEMQTIRQKMRSLFDSNQEMHDASKEFIRRTSVPGKKPQDNVLLYENLVEKSGNNLFVKALDNLIDQHQQVGQQVNTKKQEPSTKQEPSAFSPLEKASKRPLRHERSFRTSKAEKLFDLEMKHLDEKLKELGTNKKQKLKGRAKLLAMKQEHGKFVRSELDPKESLDELKASQERFAKTQKDKPPPSPSQTDSDQLSLRAERLKKLAEINTRRELERQQRLLNKDTDAIAPAFKGQHSAESPTDIDQEPSPPKSKPQ